MTTRDDDTPEPVFEGAEAIPDGPLDKRQDAAAREQGVRSEDSDDLSSPQFTALAEEAEDDAADKRAAINESAKE